MTLAFLVFVAISKAGKSESVFQKANAETSESKLDVKNKDCKKNGKASPGNLQYLLLMNFSQMIYNQLYNMTYIYGDSNLSNYWLDPNYNYDNKKWYNS